MLSFPLPHVVAGKLEMAKEEGCIQKGIQYKQHEVEKWNSRVKGFKQGDGVKAGGW